MILFHLCSVVNTQYEDGHASRDTASRQPHTANQDYPSCFFLSSRSVTRAARAVAVPGSFLHANCSSHKGTLQTVCVGVGLGHPATAVADADLHGDLFSD